MRKMYERKVKYTSISISENLMNAINTHIKKHKQNTSAGSFVRDAIKLKMDVDNDIISLSYFTDSGFNKFAEIEEIKDYIKTELDTIIDKKLNKKLKSKKK